MGIAEAPEGLEIHNARLSERNAAYAEFLYWRNQRRGLLFRDRQRQVNQDRNVFGACMVAHGDADAMVTGLTRNYTSVLRDVFKVFDPRPGERVFGLTVMVARGRTVFIADTTVHELPDRVELADIAIQTAHRAPDGLHAAGRVPVVLQPQPARRAGHARAGRGRGAGWAPRRLRIRRRDVGRRRARSRADGALPVLPLSAPANVLIMPALHTAHISKLLKQLGGGTVIGPLLQG